MMRQSFGALCKSPDGAVAPTVALSLFALIAAGGVAFDYARLASMDTELQSAADQAALAAASQLDGEPGACERAVAAAQGLVANDTLMANEEGSSRAITIADPGVCQDGEPDEGEEDEDAGDITFDADAPIRFWQDAAKTTAATDDTNAKFVEVDVTPRTAFYMLTPLVGAFSSGAIGATAFAGMGEAYCKTPPVMICNPQETGTNKEFDAAGLAGKGLRLVSVGGSTGGWAPGNFGYLDTNGGSNGVPGLREALGWSVPPGNCIAANGVDTKPGANTTVTDAINTHFDIYQGDTPCPAGGSCPASINSIKDVVRSPTASGNNACKMHNQGWQLPAGYYGSNYATMSATTPLASTVTPTAMGHPRDMCHVAAATATGACTGPIGDGKWDRDAYFRRNYGWSSADWKDHTDLPATATRFDVYMWEIGNRGDVVGGVTVLGPRASGTLESRGLPVCSPIKSYGDGVVPTTTTPDRRKMAVAVVNCQQEDVKGNSVGVDVEDWIEVFLVEPSLARANTDANDVYVEVIRSIGTPTTASTVQTVHKSVPYLIE